LTDKDYRCWGKNRVLYDKIKKAGFDVRFKVCDFNWNEQRFPPEIISLAPSKQDKHLFLEINLKNKWIVLDASNDSKLPSFNKWDGNSDCKIEVKYSNILSPEESVILEKQERKQFKETFEKNKEFYKAINIFLGKIRK
jgi:hypothetical protein